MYELVLLAHVLAATVWTGGHLVLAIAVLPGALREKSVESLSRFESAYERVGIPALLVQAITGPILAHRMVSDVGLWFDWEDPVGRLIGAKMILLIATLALGIHARFRIIPKLSAENVASLAWHIVPVAVMSTLFVVIGVSFRRGWFF